jgi:type II secretion system protein J
VRQRGFTLIEIIIATSLFTLLMASYYTVVMNVMILEETARDQRAFSSVGPAILDLVEDDLLSVYTHPRALGAYPFRGEDDSLASEAADELNFVVTRDSIHREDFHDDDTWVRSPVNEVGYKLKRADSRSGDVRRLFRREAYYVDSTPQQGGDYYEVYDRVIAFDVVYVGYPAEETERTDQDTMGEHRYDTFESWDSEERKFLPTAAIVTLTVEPPDLGSRAGREDEVPERRTFVRVIQLVQADDVLPTQGQPATEQPGVPPTPGR